MKLAPILLSTRLSAYQLGWRAPLSVLLFASALLMQREFLPAWNQSIESQSRQALRISRLPLKPLAASAGEVTTAQAQAGLQAVLGSPAALDPALQILFAAAERHGLKLPQARYTALPDREGVYRRHRIELSMSGSYSRIRFFMLDVLRSLPFASLERLRLTRRGIDADTLESTATLVFYLQPPTAPERTRQIGSRP